MSHQLKHNEQEKKLHRFIAYLMKLELEQLDVILKDLPDDFELHEKQTICYYIKQLIKKLLCIKSCETNCCLC